jgi:hypothetical protein
MPTTGKDSLVEPCRLRRFSGAAAIAFGFPVDRAAVALLSLLLVFTTDSPFSASRSNCHRSFAATTSKSNKRMDDAALHGLR